MGTLGGEEKVADSAREIILKLQLSNFAVKTMEGGGGGGRKRRCEGVGGVGGGRMGNHKVSNLLLALKKMTNIMVKKGGIALILFALICTLKEVVEGGE